MAPQIRQKSKTSTKIRLGKGWFQDPQRRCPEMCWKAFDNTCAIRDEIVGPSGRQNGRNVQPFGTTMHRTVDK